MERIGAIYIRVSTDKQEELSPDAQLRLLKEYAKSNSIYIPEELIFQDNGISGRKAEKRPEFQKMIGLAKSNEHPIDCIIVWKFSRFARNQEESILYKSLLKKNNVEVISISENTTGEFGSLIERIIEWMDEYYSIRLSGEVLRGMTESAMRGNYLAAPPIGYTHIGNGEPPKINSETSIIPLTMKNMYLNGKNETQIARYCNEKGWRTTHGNLYEARTVLYILQNPFYAGKIRWNYTERGRKLKPSNEVILTDGRHEPLWTWEEYLSLTQLITTKKKKFSKNKKQRSVSTCKHWLSGMLLCSNCGHTLAYNSALNGFQCWNYAKGRCSKSHHVSEMLIIQYVINGLKDFLKSDHIPYTVIRQSDMDTAEQIVKYKRELNKIQQREKRAKNAYLDGIDSKEEYKENKSFCEEEISRIENLINELLTIKTMDNKEELDNQMINNIKDVLLVLEDPSEGYEAKGNAIRSITDSIVFNRTDTSLNFTFKLYIA